MNNFKKEDYIELTDSSAILISSSKCPLTYEMAKKLDILIEENNNLIPMCMCDMINHDDIQFEFKCPHFNNVIYSNFKYKINCNQLN